jgi:hypothetical protein
MNYINTFIAVATDTSATMATAPVARADKKSIAVLEYELIAAKPYVLTQEDVQFAVHVQRTGLSVSDKARRTALWNEFFSKPMACMRTSPLPKTYGWGLHFNPQGKVALVAVGTPAYQQFSTDPHIAQTRAMRGKRA